MSIENVRILKSSTVCDSVDLVQFNEELLRFVDEACDNAASEAQKRDLDTEKPIFKNIRIIINADINNEQKEEA